MAQSCPPSDGNARSLRARLRVAVGLAGAATVAVLAGCGQVPSDLSAEPHAGQSQPAASSAAPSSRVSAGPQRSTPSASSLPSSAPSASASSSTSAKPRTKPTTKPASKTAKAEKAADKPTPAGPALYGPGDDGAKIRELQARLKQIDWYAGDVTDHYGSVTTAAVKGFQEKRNLQATGVVDSHTWDRLTAMTTEPSHDELYNVTAGPAIMQHGDTSDKIKELQARLAQLDWFSEKITGYYGDVTTQAVKGFQDKRGLPATGEVDQKTWDTLTGMTDEPTKQELSGGGSSSGGSAAGLDPRCLTGRAMCIDKTTQQLVWVVNGTPQLRFDVRFGADTTPTREGSFSVGWKAKDWTSTLYHSKMPYSMFFSGGQAVHYSSDFAARGYAGASHGCVNVRDLAGIKSLFNQAQVGDKVIVYRS